MTLVIPDSYYECAFFHSVAGSLQIAVVTLGVQYAGSDFANESNGLASAWGEKIMGQMVQEWKYEKMTMRTQVGVIKERVTGFPGTKTSTPSSPNNATLVRKLTSIPGRHGKGRMYLPGISAIDITSGGKMNSAYTAGVVVALQNFQAECTALHFNLMLLHNPPKSGGPAPFPSPITGWLVDGLIGQQQRRLR
jgi:hypothetical protein